MNDERPEVQAERVRIAAVLKEHFYEEGLSNMGETQALFCHCNEFAVDFDEPNFREQYANHVAERLLSDAARTTEEIA